MSRDPKSNSEPFSPARFVLLLHSVSHLGEKTLTRLLHLNARDRVTPDAFLALSPAEWQSRYDLDPRAVAYLCEHRDALLARSEELARVTRQYDLQVLTPQSLTYPVRLERFDDAPPPILYARGNLALLSHIQAPQPPPAQSPANATAGKHSAKLYNVNAEAPDRAHKPEPDAYRKAARAPFTFSVAVSNGANTATLSRQDALAESLVQRGCVVVTGHDRTAYKRLALSAQRQNRPVIYVMDRGLRESLGPEFDRPPFTTARIRETVFNGERDLALSPFRLDDHALGANNRRRDHIVYSLADLIIALDVRAGGGMAAECRRAHEQGRMVWVAPAGRDGNEELRQAGCPPLPADIAHALRAV